MCYIKIGSMSSKLNTNWIMWYHNPNDSNWEMSSYYKVLEIRTIENFWEACQVMKEDHIQSGMFFLMREGVNPVWEDSFNIDGGCWSFRVSKKDVAKMWQELLIIVLGEQLMVDSNHSNTINGLSLSPKRSFCLIKIWNNSTQLQDINHLMPIYGVNTDEIIYKAHVESIDKDKIKKETNQNNQSQ